MVQLLSLTITSNLRCFHLHSLASSLPARSRPHSSYPVTGVFAISSVLHGSLIDWIWYSRHRVIRMVSLSPSRSHDSCCTLSSLRSYASRLSFLS